MCIQGTLALGETETRLCWNGMFGLRREAPVRSDSSLTYLGVCRTGRIWPERESTGRSWRQSSTMFQEKFPLNCKSKIDGFGGRLFLFPNSVQVGGSRVEALICWRVWARCPWVSHKQPLCTASRFVGVDRKNKTNLNSWAHLDHHFHCLR